MRGMTRRTVVIAGFVVVLGLMVVNHMTKKHIDTGDRAPDFSATDHSGAEFSLSQRLTSGPVVLFFYPADFSPICTAQVCSFRDSYQDFVDAGAQVVGISGDSGDSHQRFAAEHDLPFTLLSDADGSIAKAYGTRALFGLAPGRVTFVIDQDGIVRHNFKAQLQSSSHVEEALAVVRQLATNGKD